VKDICRSRHRNSPTSLEANAKVAPVKQYLRRRICAWFSERGPATCEQASNALGIRYTTMSARISELKADGLLVVTGERHRTSGGTSAAMLRTTTPEEQRKRAEPVQLDLLSFSV
jgi:predicted ArsR family transcriptional regulator